VSSPGTTQNLFVSLPDARVGVLDGPSLALAWRRWAQAVTNIGNSIPDTGQIAAILAELVTLAEDIATAQEQAAEALADAQQALAQTSPTIGRLSLARLDGSAA
jgi:hypothetical protein